MASVLSSVLSSVVSSGLGFAAGPTAGQLAIAGSFPGPTSDWRPVSGRVAILSLLPSATGSVVTNNPFAWIDLWLCSCYFFLHDATSQYKASSAQFYSE